MVYEIPFSRAGVHGTRDQAQEDDHRACRALPDQFYIGHRIYKDACRIRILFKAVRQIYRPRLFFAGERLIDFCRADRRIYADRRAAARGGSAPRGTDFAACAACLSLLYVRRKRRYFSFGIPHDGRAYRYGFVSSRSSLNRYRLHCGDLAFLLARLPFPLFERRLLRAR